MIRRANEKEEKLSKDKIHLENAKLLIELMTYEGKMFWERYNLYLVLNSGLVVALAYLLKETLTRFLLVGLLAISIIGFSSSVVWALILSRAFAYYKHWIRLARNIEETHLQELTIFKKEKEFKEGLKFYEKAPIHIASLLIPSVFSVLWLCIAFWVLLLLTNSFLLN